MNSRLFPTCSDPLPGRTLASLLTGTLLWASLICAPAAVTLQDGGFDLTPSAWTGSGQWEIYSFGSNRAAALAADNLQPFYSAPGPGYIDPALPSQARISQSLEGFIPGNAYEISFDLGYVRTYRINGFNDPLPRLNPAGIQLRMDGLAVGLPVPAVPVTLVDPNATFNSYTGMDSLMERVSLTFIATAETHVISLQSLEIPPDPALTIDVTRSLVLVDHVNLQPVPEPAGISLLCGSAALLGFRRKRRVSLAG